MNTDEARDEFLKVHNECRAKVAKGGIRMGNGISSRACPRMKKIPKYDCELEKKAYATASACKSADPETENENWFTTTAATEKDAATKMVWDLNTQMGCAVKKCSNDWHVVCHYGPGVGRLGSPIYFMGPKACNQCLDKCENDALCLP
ncbi:SCP-like protein [Ancylostoma ceylanicum]|uniref:SCP-like protein n=1 Tax=Ancylostoma ceylanicum TaxID=53326 RepID=A0A0D6L5I2_9BILA|nr:SCP-like protein [Ancylostoma ceylanicum]